jgi:diaminohydroxyphosphoribosylaminopyrimidine deaminase/5-amino-6-(5-phosphoribosylamino)uracil reductase
MIPLCQLSDEEAMSLAITQGLNGRTSAPPNPWVGAVLLDQENRLIGQGFHEEPGTPHAEVMAIQNAIAQGYGQLLLKSRCFVSLEPCSHHGRTPPCTQALIDHGISNLFYGITDPDPKVSGKGLKILQEGQISTTPFPSHLKQEAIISLLPYLHHRQTQRPYVIVKIATTLDGMSHNLDRSRQQLTCTEVAQDAHQTLRDTSQAILIGINTLLSDLPHLDRRYSSSTLRKKLLRVIIDPAAKSRQLIGQWDFAANPTLIVSAEELASPQAIEKIESAGAQCHTLPLDELRNLDTLLHLLAKDYQIIQLLIEGGSKTLNQFFSRNLVNQVVLYQAPYFAGSNHGHAIGPLPIDNLSQAIQGTIIETASVGLCCKIIWKPKDQTHRYKED